MQSNTVVIIGAGPAGLTAAYELARQSQTRVIVLEASGDIGGISKTVNHKGNRIDIGGHRFFSKSDWVMDWWRDILPVQGENGAKVEIAYQNKRRLAEISTGAQGDQVMLVRNRLSRIYCEGKFFAYPVKADFDTALKLGPTRIARILATYGGARMFPRQPETTLEDFLLNRFGRELYETFFREYTEKVWGVPCSEISAEWGAQRIKGLNVTRAALNALSQPIRKVTGGEVKNTSLIERFLYPKFGPGQLWETVAQKAKRAGVEIRMQQKVVGLDIAGDRVTSVVAEDSRTGERHRISADHVLSTMPISELITAMKGAAPSVVQDVAKGLQYRDFITVGLLLKKLRPNSGAVDGSPLNIVPDNWIYIQDKGVKVGRLQIFNNWSPSMVADANTVWIGMEYFCREQDAMWNLSDSKMTELAIEELRKIGLAEERDLLDSTVLRVQKAYPGYFGSYDRFGAVRDFTDSLSNLFLIGRNGMHRYNNQDHSMLTARYAVESILRGGGDKSAIWDINVGDDYHEEKRADVVNA